MKRGLGLLLCLVATVSCSSGSSSSTTASTAPSTTTTVASTTASSTTTTDLATTTSAGTTTSTSTTTIAVDTAPTSTVATPIAADDWKAVLEELDRRVVSLYAQPDLARIGDYCATGSDCASGLESQLSDAIAKGEHVEGQHSFEVTEVTNATVGDPTPTGQRIATVEFVIAPDSPPPARLVDAQGNLVDTLSVTTTPSRGRFTLVSVDDPILPWRLLLAESLGPAG